MSKRETAVTYFNSGFHCAQSVFATFAEEAGIPKETALKIATPFGSGMRKAEVCGACSGALMVIGALFGQDCEAHKDDKIHTNALTERFLEEFARVNGSVVCRDLLHCDIGTAEGLACARENNLFTQFCPKMVASAVEVLEKVLAEA